MSFKKSVSFWLFVALAVLVGLQLPAVPGIVLLALGTPILAGLLANALLVSLFLEAIARRIPRLLAAIPVLLYSIYYAHFIKERFEIAETASQIEATNPGLVLAFDPARHSLVKEGASSTVSNYDVPVAYENNKNVGPVGYLSYRLLTMADCIRIQKDTNARVNTFGVTFGNPLQQPMPRNVCELQFPEAPGGQIVRVVQDDELLIRKNPNAVIELSTNLVVGESILATYRTALVRSLPILPLGYIGCSLDSRSAAWGCGAAFSRRHYIIDGVPPQVDRTLYDTPASVMLGLRKRTLAEMQAFRNYPDTEAAIAAANAVIQAGTDEAFAHLEAVLSGQNPKPGAAAGYTLQSNLSRLVPYAPRMVERLAAMKGHLDLPNYAENYRLLSEALAKITEANSSL